MLSQHSPNAKLSYIALDKQYELDMFVFTLKLGSNIYLFTVIAYEKLKQSVTGLVYRSALPTLN